MNLTGPNVDDPRTARTLNWKTTCKFGTWNCRTLKRPGSTTELEKEIQKYGIDIAALQEIRWPGTGDCELEKGVILYSGREDGRSEEGVGFYIKKALYGQIEEFEAISSRLARVRLRAKWFKVTLIVAHAPTEVSDDDTKDDWYSALEETLNKVPRHDALVILGDMNAKVGREVDAFGGTIGSHSLHEESNDNGLRLTSLATQHGLVIGGTLFPHKAKHKGTWISPDGMTTNQIDHILVRKKFRTSLYDVRAYRGAECDSDHYLVIAKIRIKLNTQKNKATISKRIDTSKLRSVGFRRQ